MFLEEERKSFIDDYRLTACMNVLKWFVTNLSEQVGNMFIVHPRARLQDDRLISSIIKDIFMVIIVIMVIMLITPREPRQLKGRQDE